MEEVKTDLNIKKSIVTKQFVLWKRILIYGVILAILGISIILCLTKYIKYQKVNLEAIPAVSLQEFIDNDAIIIKEQKLKMSFTPYKFNELIKSGIANAQIPSLKGSKILECQYDNKSHLAYLNVDNKGTIYSLICKANISINDKNLILSLSNYRLGRMKSNILGYCYKFSLGLPNEIKLILPNKYNIIFAQSINQVSDDVIEINYDYDYNELAKRFKLYKKQVDETKINIYKKNTQVPSEIVNAFTVKDENKDELAKCIKVLEQDDKALEKCSLLLNEQGIRDICGDLKKFYAKDINVDKIVEKSENELSKNLRKYHYDFSKMLLKFLYENKDYILENGCISIKGEILTAEKILNYYSYTKVYDIDLISDNQGIKAIYKLGNKNITKIILSKE